MNRFNFEWLRPYVFGFLSAIVVMASIWVIRYNKAISTVLAYPEAIESLEVEKNYQLKK